MRLLSVFLVFGSMLVAQSGSLSGRVLDESGAPIPDALLTLTNAANGFRAERTTNASGGFAFYDLRPGEHRLKASARSFQTVEKTVRITVAARVTSDFTLAVQTAETSVEVRDRAMAVDREGSSVNTLFDQEFVRNLPLNGRSFQSLLELTPGVVLAPATISNPGQFAVNGQRTNANYFMVDGVAGNVAVSASATFTQQAAGTLPGLNILGGSNGLVSVDALEEFRVVTSSYSAEYGRSPGAQVLLVTRSGTNRYSGSLYNYFRNEKLDANDWFANRSGIARQALRQNNYGGTFGGPVWIPGLYRGKDKTFFFVSHEGLRLRQPQAAVRSTLVPSLAARQRANAAAKAVFDAFPLPNAPLLATDRQDPNLARYVSGVSNPASFDAFSARFDERFTDQVQLFFRYNRSPSESLSRVFANQDNFNAIGLTTATVGLTWTLRPTLTSDLRFNWSDSSGGFNFLGREIDGAVLPDDALLFGPNFPRATTSVSLQLGVVGLTQGRTLGNDQRQYNLVQTTSWFRGGHSLKLGVDYRRLLPEVKFRTLGITHSFQTRSGSNGVTDLLETGRVNTQIQALAPVTGFRVNNFSGFVHDTWRATRRLTLNFGLRWEINPPPDGKLLPFRLDQVDSLLTAQLAPANTELYETQWANLAPRGGLAWQLNRSGDFVLRGGAGLFYDVGNGPALGGFTSFPYNSLNNLSTTWPVPASLIVPTPFNQNPPYQATFRVMDPNLELPYTIQWNVSLEKGVGENHLFTASYVGSDASRLLRTEVLRNQSAFGQPVVPVINPTLFASTSSVFLTRNAANSNYHALQLQYQRRMSRGLQALASYTWSKARDNMSDEATAGLPLDGLPGFNAELDREYAPASFDVRQILTAAATWRIPGSRQSWALRWLTSGWATDAILRVRTGLPFSVITQAVDPLNFGSNRRVDYVGGTNWLDDPKVPGGRRLNPAAFRIPPTGRQGTLGRNALRGFGARQFDLTARREFELTETLKLQFRGELFNAFNTPNFGLPNSGLNPFPDAFFGQATQMLGRSLGGGGTSGGLSPLYQVGGPRSVQLSLRLFF